MLKLVRIRLYDEFGSSAYLHVVNLHLAVFIQVSLAKHIEVDVGTLLNFHLLTGRSINLLI